MEISQANLNKVVDLMGGCDGEDLNWVIDELGMEDQMLRQLVIKEDLRWTMRTLTRRASDSGMPPDAIRSLEKWFEYLMTLEEIRKAKMALYAAQDKAARVFSDGCSNTPTIDKIDVGF